MSITRLWLVAGLASGALVVSGPATAAPTHPVGDSVVKSHPGDDGPGGGGGAGDAGGDHHRATGAGADEGSRVTVHNHRVVRHHTHRLEHRGLHHPRRHVEHEDHGMGPAEKRSRPDHAGKSTQDRGPAGTGDQHKSTGQKSSTDKNGTDKNNTDRTAHSTSHPSPSPTPSHRS